MPAKTLTVDFAVEKEDGYRRVFKRSPLLSSLTAAWGGVYFAYDYMLPGETPEIIAKQHGLAIFTDMATPIQAERRLDGRLQRESVLEGDIVVAPAHMGHSSRWDKPGGVILVGFDSAGLSQAAYEAIDLDQIELVPQFATPDPLVYQMGLALKSVLETYGQGSRLYAETMSNALFVHVLQHYTVQQVPLKTCAGGLPRHRLQQVVEYVQAHLEHDLSLVELAAIAQMSPHYFSQLFKQSTGLTPHRYVIACRVKRAKQLLHHSSLSIADVARMVGFVDQSHLTRHFKQHLGITPKVFLQQVK